jgi:hypothetical protein
MARKKYSFYIEESQADALKAVKVRDGVLESEQIFGTDTHGCVVEREYLNAPAE